MSIPRLLRLFAAFALILSLAAAVLALSQHHASPAQATATAQVLPATTTPNVYAVERVVDGDTLDVRMGNGTVRLRLIGMDTPEVVDARKPVQCFGREASAEGHKLLEGQYVRLEYDAVTGTKDIYGRTLAYVFLTDGTFYNEFMIESGFAHEYDYENQKYKYRAEFQAAQAHAKAAQLGFWSPQTCGGNTTKPAGAQ